MTIKLNRSKFGNWPSGPRSKLQRPTLFMPGFMGGGGGVTIYPVANSIRLRASNSASFSRTNVASPTNTRVFTYSFWVKRGTLTAGAPMAVIGGGNGGGTDNIGFGDLVTGGGSNDQLQIRDTGTGAYAIRTNRRFRDTQGWYHIVVAVDTTQATATNRLRLYVNGVEETSFESSTWPALNYVFDWNTGSRTCVLSQRFPSSGTYFFDGLLSEVHLIDGQQLTPSSFGQFDPLSNQWVPRRYAGAYGANGFFLEFKDASAATAAAIGKDTSGNANNWTPSGISVTAGVTFDQLTDTPTNNHATMNPIWAGANGFSWGNLRVSPNSNQHATISVDSGGFYFEGTLTQLIGSNESTGIGIVNLANSSDSRYIRSRLSDCAVKTTTAAEATGFGFWSPGDIIGIAFNPTTNFFEVRRNNVVQASSSSAGLSGAVWVPQVQSQSSAQLPVWDLNFGQRPFAYTPPNGFAALNTQNLPNPTIRRGDEGFDVRLRAGSNSPVSVSDLRFPPDLVWTKSRNTADHHNVADRVRGPNLNLQTSNTNAEDTLAILTAFGANGYTLGGGFGRTNAAGQNFVDWVWREGAAYGFDIVTYTGTGSARTVAHGLNAVPHMMIVKPRGGTVANGWRVYHRSLANTQYLQLNTTAAADTYNDWNNTTPTSSVFSVNGTPAQTTNENGTNYVAYLWTSIPGFSLFGSYTGNGSADGPFVWCGFRPRWVMIKRTDSANTWWCYDAARNTFNVTNLVLGLNDAAVESTSFGGSTRDIDLTANGFKLRTSNDPNGSSGNFIFAAFAENPFKFANAR